MAPQNLPHYQRSLEEFLASSQGSLTPSTSSRVMKAREKLKKLTTIQFSDLSTDVYDEMQRRETNKSNPNDPDSLKFLPSQTNYHPKRNQARQKLAALPPSRFKDLVNDVLFEINNRMKDQNIDHNSNSSVTSSSTHNQNLNHISSKTVDPESADKNHHNLTIDVEKSNNYKPNPLDTSTSSFLTSNKNSPITPSQREIKPTTLVPQKAELTWSSDEEEENEIEGEKNVNTIHNKRTSNSKLLDINDEGLNLSEADKDAINRSPSKRYTIATNEVLNEHAPPNVEFPIDDDNDAESNNDSIQNHLTNTEITNLKLKNDELELENSHLKSNNVELDLIKSENDKLKRELEVLTEQKIESDDKIQLLTNEYEGYDSLKEELDELKEKYLSQTDELNELKELNDIRNEKQLSVEDSREFDTLKAYLDKVLEENEELKSKLADYSAHDDDIEEIRQRNLQYENEENEAIETLKQKDIQYQDLQAEYENLKNGYEDLENNFADITQKYESLNNKYEALNNSYEELNDKYENLSKSHSELSSDYDSLKSKSAEGESLISKYKTEAAAAVAALAAATAVTATTAAKSASVVAASTSAAIPIMNPAVTATSMHPESVTETTAKSIPTSEKESDKVILDLQQKFELLRSDQLEIKLNSVKQITTLNNNHLFNSNGLVSIKQVTNISASLETVLLYLDTIKENSRDGNFNPSILFERVSIFVSHANAMLIQINIPSHDKIFSAVEEKKRILKNAIFSSLSTAKNYVLYYHIFPKLVLNAALNDVYLAVCSLLTLVKIKIDDPADSQNNEDADVTNGGIQKNDYLQDNATLTATPIALKNMNRSINDISPISKNTNSIPSSTPNPNSNFNSTKSLDTSVRPLRITQRLASQSSISLDDSNGVTKPTLNSSSRNASPMMLSTSLLPMIVASTDNVPNISTPTSTTSNAFRSPLAEKNISKDSNISAIKQSPSIKNVEYVENVKNTENTENVESFENGENVSLYASDQESPEKPLNCIAPNNKPLVSNITSKLLSPERPNIQQDESKNNFMSPLRGKNISEKMKKFDPSVENITMASDSSPSKITSEANLAVDNGSENDVEAFEKFSAKRRNLSSSSLVSSDTSVNITNNGISKNTVGDEGNYMNDSTLEKNPFVTKSKKVSNANGSQNNELTNPEKNPFVIIPRDVAAEDENHTDEVSTPEKDSFITKTNGLNSTLLFSGATKKLTNTKIEDSQNLNKSMSLHNDSVADFDDDLNNFVDAETSPVKTKVAQKMEGFETEKDLEMKKKGLVKNTMKENNDFDDAVHSDNQPIKITDKNQDSEVAQNRALQVKLDDDLHRLDRYESSELKSNKEDSELKAGEYSNIQNNKYLAHAEASNFKGTENGTLALESEQSGQEQIKPLSVQNGKSPLLHSDKSKFTKSATKELNSEVRKTANDRVSSSNITPLEHLRTSSDETKHEIYDNADRSQFQPLKNAPIQSLNSQSKESQDKEYETGEYDSGLHKPQVEIPRDSENQSLSGAERGSFLEDQQGFKKYNDVDTPPAHAQINDTLTDDQKPYGSTANDIEAEKEEEDFNDYGNRQAYKSNESDASGLQSASKVLEVDENLVKRVSKRLSRRVSKVPSEASSGRKGWEYNGEEDDDDEDDEFDVDKFNTLNPDNTLRELLLYLEHQTVEVIKAIQQTLQSIRDPKATKGLLRIGATEINNVVKQMTEGTSTLMNQSRYIESMGHAKYVVGVLQDCVRRMEGLYGKDTTQDSEYAGKNFKQRSAGIAFDVARSTKELVKTVEEASLRDEIAVLDSRLRRD